VITYSMSSGVVCTLYAEAKARNDSAKWKIWTYWKLDYLKHAVHVESVAKIRSKNSGFRIRQMLTESPEARKLKEEFSARWRSKDEQVKILIDDVLLAVRVNKSMLSVQEIHDYMAKYMSIPESWRRKNYAFEFRYFIL
uniref:Uncharacterized protein n=1 Tax=Latimeria chalumnae TaxID=7897 RepID=H3A158_LATCH